MLQNGDRVRFDFLFVDFSAPEWLALVGAIGIGVVLDRLFLVWWRRRRGRTPDAA